MRYILLLFSLINISYGQSIVTVRIDSELIEKVYVNAQGLITKSIHFDSANNRTDTLFYRYLKGRISNINSKGDGSVIGFDEDDLKNRFDNAFLHEEILRKYGIIYPLPYINMREMGEIMRMLGLAERLGSVKRQGNSLIANLNTKIDFRQLNMKNYIPSNFVIYKYIIEVVDNFPVKEEVHFELGTLTRTYHYENGRLIKIVWECKYDDDEMLYGEVETFSYE